MSEKQYRLWRYGLSQIQPAQSFLFEANLEKELNSPLPAAYLRLLCVYLRP